MHHVHSKVYPAICGVHAKQDRHLYERCWHLRGKLTPSVVGVSDDYECRYPMTLAHLKRIESLETPLEILYTIQDAMVSQTPALCVCMSCPTILQDSIMEDVKDNFIKSLRIGGKQDSFKLVM